MDILKQWFNTKFVKSDAKVTYKQPQPGTNPNQKWNEIKDKQIFIQVTPMDPDTPKLPNHTRFVCISDTHGFHDNLKVPDGDVLLHAGDFTDIGTPKEIENFNQFLKKLKHKHKIVIAGNHDLSLDERSFDATYPRFKKLFGDKCTTEYAKSLLKDCRYLEHELIEVEGFKIFGSPWQPEFLGWAFNLERGEELENKWKSVPANIDILVTHTPPLGRGDECMGGGRSGCYNLLKHVQERIKPKYHIFGHIHEGYGTTMDNVTTYINCSTCTYSYRPDHLNIPIVFDLENKVHQKEKKEKKHEEIAEMTEIVKRKNIDERNQGQTEKKEENQGQTEKKEENQGQTKKKEENQGQTEKKGENERQNKIGQPPDTNYY